MSHDCLKSCFAHRHVLWMVKDAKCIQSQWISRSHNSWKNVAVGFKQGGWTSSRVTLLCWVSKQSSIDFWFVFEGAVSEVLQKVSRLNLDSRKIVPSCLKSEVTQSSPGYFWSYGEKVNKFEELARGSLKLVCFINFNQECERPATTLWNLKKKVFWGHMK